MTLWRDSVDLMIPMKDDFKLHFMRQRKSILSGFENTARAWLMALRPAVPDPGDTSEFDALLREIEAFETWAKSELAKLADLAND